MASFDQSPLGQVSKALTGFTLLIGNQTNDPDIKVNYITYSNAGELSHLIKLALSPETRIFPDWRRESRKVG